VGLFLCIYFVWNILKNLKVICAHGIAVMSKSLSDSWHDFVITEFQRKVRKSCFVDGFGAEKPVKIWVRFTLRHYTDERNGFLSTGLEVVSSSLMQVAVQIVGDAPPCKPFASLARTTEAVVHLGSASTRALALETAPALGTVLEMASPAVEKCIR